MPSWPHGRDEMMIERGHEQLPDRETVRLARTGAVEIGRLLDKLPETDSAHVKLDGQDLVLPRQALILLRDLLADMAQGDAVTVVPLHAEMTTQQAADILNVSRPYLITLLEKGELRYTKVGTHRRIQLKDLMAYKDKIRKQSAEAMDELVSIAQENNLGY